ncbi:MAG: MEDS domain-containing protein [Acidobacteriota bacterium]|nr:MEDS domain-containing protein [Acidobacteriota bacterium]
MNSKAAAILANPQPCGHIVFPYTQDWQVADAVCLFASAGLKTGAAVVLVVTETHCAQISDRLRAQGFDVAALLASGQLICEDAATLLSSFFFDGVIDESRFKKKIGEAIQRARWGSGQKREVRIFGEMVDLIWQPWPKATERLEELWNHVIEEHAVPLLCAYALGGSRPAELPAALAHLHSHHLDRQPVIAGA